MSLQRRTGVVVAMCGLAAALVGCGSEPAAAPPPPPSPTASAAAQQGPQDVRRVPPGQELTSFQRALAQRGLVVGTNPEETTLYAQTICGELDGGFPIEQVVLDVQQGSAFTLNDTGYVIGAAVSTFCPQNLARLPQQ